MARKQDYTPMHLLHRWQETEPVALKNTEGTPLQKINADPEQYLDYAISPRFAKRSYDGAHKEINDYMIEQITKQKNEKKGIFGNSYAEIRTEMRDLITIPGIIYKWSHYKQAYIFDPDFAEELQKTNNVKIPLSLFGSMPYPCYYVDLQNIEKFRPFIGCFVYVHMDPKAGIPDITLLKIADPPKGYIDEMCYTAYFDSRLIERHLLDFERDEHGQYIIHPNHIYFRFDDRIDTGDNIRTSVTDKNGVFVKDAFKETHANELLIFIFQTIFYLASYHPDVTPSKRYARKTKPTNSSNTETPSDLTVSDVGIRYGNTIRIQKQAIRNNCETDHTAGNRPRKPMTSHIRRAHWHKYWTGKGRTTQIVKWIPPVFVCGNKELPVTIHQVK